MRSVLAFLVIALALTVPSAHASPSVRYSSNGGTLYPGPLNELGSGYRSIGLDNVTNATILRDVVDATIEGQRAGMAVRRAIPLAGALALGARALGPLGAAATLYDLYQSLRCAPSGGLIVCDEGVVPEGSGSTQSITVGETGYFEIKQTSVVVFGVSGQTVSKSFSPGVYQCTTDVFGTDPAYGRSKTCTVPPQSVPTCAVGPDGRCPGGSSVALTPDQAASRALPFADPTKAPQAVRDALSQGIDVAPYAQELPAVGPSSLSGPSSTTTNASGQSVTQGVTYNISYFGDSYTYNITNTTTNNTTGETTTTTQAPKAECGVPGRPPCAVKVDEEGTPAWQDRDGSGLDALKAAEAAKRDELMGQVPQPDLGWFGAPPIAECTPFEYPNGMGSINPCGVVSNVREVMAYLWALAAAWLSFGMIRKAATGGS